MKKRRKKRRTTYELFCFSCFRWYRLFDKRRPVSLARLFSKKKKKKFLESRLLSRWHSTRRVENNRCAMENFFHAPRRGENDPFPISRYASIGFYGLAQSGASYSNRWIKIAYRRVTTKRKRTLSTFISHKIIIHRRTKISDALISTKILVIFLTKISFS